MICKPAAAQPQTQPLQAAEDAADDTTGTPDGPRGESPDSPSLTFNFQNADWQEALKLFAEAAGLKLDLTDIPPGSFNYIDPQEHTLPDAVDVLNGYLLLRGYVVIRRDRFLAVLKTDNPILPNLIPTVPASSLPQYGEHELVRLSVPLNGLDAEQVAEQVQGVLGPHGSASPRCSRRGRPLAAAGSSPSGDAEPAEVAGRCFEMKQTAAGRG